MLGHSQLLNTTMYELRVPLIILILQKVVNDYHPKDRRRTEEGNVLAGPSSHTFATALNLDSSIAYLCSSLAGLTWHCIKTHKDWRG